MRPQGLPKWDIGFFCLPYGQSRGSTSTTGLKRSCRSLPQWRMFESQCLAENRGKRGFSISQQVVGFVAIFNEANYPSEVSVNASFST